MTEPVNNEQLAELLAETSKIAWKELQYFFAGGRTVRVSAELDLIDVAAQMARDHKTTVESWMQNQQIGPVSTTQAKKWYDNDATVWAVVVKPWILVQEVKADQLNDG